MLVKKMCVCVRLAIFKYIYVYVCIYIYMYLTTRIIHPVMKTQFLLFSLFVYISKSHFWILSFFPGDLAFGNYDTAGKILNICSTPFPNMTYLPLSIVNLLGRSDRYKFKCKIFRLHFILKHLILQLTPHKYSSREPKTSYFMNQ